MSLRKEIQNRQEAIKNGQPSFQLFAKVFTKSLTATFYNNSNENFGFGQRIQQRRKSHSGDVNKKHVSPFTNYQHSLYRNLQTTHKTCTIMNMLPCSIRLQQCSNFCQERRPLPVCHQNSCVCTCLASHHGMSQNTNRNKLYAGGRHDMPPPRPATEARSSSLQPGRPSWARSANTRHAPGRPHTPPADQMNATDIRQTDVRQHHRLMPLGGGIRRRSETETTELYR